ncbi:SLATT domain-containing protein [Actinoplanes rectilineatus]|uniref:SLATT domain-containing protein n=1 Tax=Actinoplanes rectilineatus TaxID=113571 RepID=UPI0005F2AE0A|nr:SLATT domain-containing protein [Actinoplanes rectilineatus]
MTRPGPREPGPDGPGRASAGRTGAGKADGAGVVTDPDGVAEPDVVAEPDGVTEPDVVTEPDGDAVGNEWTAAVRVLYRELRVTDQLEFYRQRATEYTRAARQAIAVRNTLLGLAATVGAAGQFIEGTGRVATGVAAAVLAAMAAAITAYETLIGFTPIAKLYEDAADSLEEADLHWDTGDDMAAEVDRIETVFHTEAGRWGQLTIQTTPPTTPVPGAPPPPAP